MNLRWPTLLAAAMLGACTGVPTRPDGELRIIVLRHAEKDGTVADDPPLSAAGEQRAARIAQRLAATPLAAVYSTPTRRTRATATPAAGASQLPVRDYDPRQPVAGFAAELRREHARGNVLVLGHSNTVPAIVAALCNCPVAPMDDAEYDRWSEVRIRPGAQARLLQERY